ncbi:hypothetical protein H5V45_14000 [Nocardioides sp. KIGAM211]|uniref:DUF2157 domain-containing protein n=1 Tax=Nocardioides luti TaxID=2761101 RepID=A0A7X0VBA2_9ACTN|nr:hypothetical protein [Nocardioides luti]MBB6628436.1 hypothetical protein [Nocardioides luti]
MPRYADPSLCPDCHAVLPVGPATCPRCRLPLQGPLAARLLETLSTADRLLAELRLTAPAFAPVAEAWTPEAYPAASRAEAPRRRGLGAPSVPRILLSLGALCLLVAAVTFLAVAWSWLGVGGRTAILVALTVLSSGLGHQLARKDLRLAGEALTVVAFGLLTLDVIGADNAGWLGDLDTSGLAVAVGGTLLVVALVLALAGRTRLTAPEVVAPLGLLVAAAGAFDATGHPDVVATVAVLAGTALALLARSQARPVLLGSSLTVALGWWLVLVASGLADAADHASFAALWADGHGVTLATAAVLALLPLVARAPSAAVTSGLAAAAVLASVAIALPGVDHGTTRLALVALAGLLVWSAVALVVDRRRLAAPAAPMALAALVVAVVAAGLVASAIATVLGVGAPFTRPLGVRLEPVDGGASPALLVPLALGLLLAGLAVAPAPRRTTIARSVAPLVVLAAVGTLALQPVPLGTVVVALLATGAALLALGVRRHDDGGLQASTAGAAVCLAAAVVALPSAGLTLVALLAVVGAAATAALRGARADVVLAGETVLPAALAALLWTAGEVVGLDEALRAAPLLLVVGLLAIARPRPLLEGSAALAGAVAAVASIAVATDQDTSLALHLTLAGALVTASALVHPSRRLLAWPGGLLLAAATWVRLADLGVDAPEAYTLPTAVALVLVGLAHLRREPGSSTAVALAPGLVLATVPSLLWVLTGDPVTLRALLLGLGCLGLVLAGLRLRWGAPLVVGSAAGALVVLRELAPYAGGTPQWVLIGLAGTLLTVLGVTWESRLRDVQHASAYLARLR